MSEQAFLMIALGVIIGGFIGARLAKVAPWKGALLMLVGMIVSVGIGLALGGTGGGILNWIATLVAVGIVGGAMKLSGREMGSVVLGGFLFGAVGSFVAVAAGL